MIASYQSVVRNGFVKNVGVLVGDFSVDEGYPVTLEADIENEGEPNVADLSLTVLANLANAYAALTAASPPERVIITMQVTIDGLSVTDDLTGDLSMSWQDEGGGSGSLTLARHQPFTALPITNRVRAGQRIGVSTTITVQGVDYNLDVFQGYVSDVQYDSATRTVGVNFVDLSYPLQLRAARISKQFTQTRKSTLLNLVAQMSGIVALQNERQGETEDEVMINKITANSEFPLDFMRKVSVPQTWKMGFTPTGVLRIYREEIKATPDYTFTDATIVAGTLQFTHRTDGVINKEEIFGATYPIDKKIKPPTDACNDQSKVTCTIPNHITLTDQENACRIVGTDTCIVCIKDTKKPKDNTPTDPCDSDNNNKPPLTLG